MSKLAAVVSFLSAKASEFPEPLASLDRMLKQLRGKGYRYVILRKSEDGGFGFDVRAPEGVDPSLSDEIFSPVEVTPDGRFSFPDGLQYLPGDLNEFILEPGIYSGLTIVSAVRDFLMSGDSSDE